MEFPQFALYQIPEGFKVVGVMLRIVENTVHWYQADKLTAGCMTGTRPVKM